MGRSEPQIEAKRAFTSTELAGQASRDGTVEATTSMRPAPSAGLLRSAGRGAPAG
jgi:hypothetical protein